MNQTIKHKTNKKKLTGCQVDPYHQLPICGEKNHQHYCARTVFEAYVLRKGFPDNVLAKLDCGKDQRRPSLLINIHIR